jgi:hypothetical protein
VVKRALQIVSTDSAAAEVRAQVRASGIHRDGAPVGRPIDDDRPRAERPADDALVAQIA